jgi:hypothetical protein
MPVPVDRAPHCEQVLWSVLFKRWLLIFNSRSDIFVNTLVVPAH